MELSNRPVSARFTSARAVRIVSETGNMCANFTKGETRRIPKALFNAALTAGLIPEDTLEAKDLQEPEAPKNMPREERVQQELIAACKKMVSAGNPADFVLSGYPRAASAKKLVDFDFTAAELRAAFEQAMHEVEQNGDDSTEHSEPSVSVTE